MNFGCGDDVRRGWVNVDAFLERPGIVKHDIVRTPWPFTDASVRELYTAHVLEHVPLLWRERDGVQVDVLFDIIREAWRVLEPGGTWEIRVPPANTYVNWAHPQHYRRFHEDTFSYWNRRLIAESWLHDAEFEILSVRRRHMPTERGRPGRNPPLLPAWKFRGIPVLDHLRIRTRWIPSLWRLLSYRGEIVAILRKPAREEVRTS